MYAATIKIYHAKKHLSGIDFLLNQLLVPAISPSPKNQNYNQNFHEMSRGKIQKCRLKFKQLFPSKLFSSWKEKKKNSKIHNKSKCNSQYKMSNQKKS